MTVVAPVLVALDQDGVAARDEQSGSGVARQVVIDRAFLPVVHVREGRLDGCPSEPRRRVGATDQTSFQEVVLMAEDANPEPGAIDGFDRVVQARTVFVSVRAVCTEARSGTRNAAGRRGAGPGRVGFRSHRRLAAGKRETDDAEKDLPNAMQVRASHAATIQIDGSRRSI